MSSFVEAQVKAVSFAVYTDSEIRGVSVKRITRFPAFDAQGLALEGGLYDPAMGPLSADESCATCGLRSRHCPGHVGHIELPVPVVNPMMVGMVYKIMRMLCFNCHNFCVAEGKAWRLDAVALQLQLLEKGLAHEAAEIVDRERYDRAAAAYPPAVLAKVRPAAAVDTIMATKVKFDVIERLLSTRTTSCSFCHAVSPGMRKYGAEGSVYRKKMEPGAVLRNLKYDVKIEDDVFKQPEFGHETRSRDELATRDACLEQRWISPLELEEHLRRAWKSNPRLCALVWNHVADGALDKAPSSHSIFFTRALLVPANRFRPPTRGNESSDKGGGRAAVGEHPHNMHLNGVLQVIDELSKAGAANKNAAAAAAAAADADAPEAGSDHGDDDDESAPSKTPFATLWVKLQGSVASFFTSQRTTATLDTKMKYAGVKQLLERKEGLFRRNMMGKRVNFAARTVISPDPLLETNEIGVPLVFATKLTFPTRVTAHNHAAMAQAVVNGADVHPGATLVTVGGRTMHLHNMQMPARVALSRNLLSHDPSHPEDTAVVHAHVRTGDVVLVNRQPSLHKPSMMGHRVKVLGKERVLRMHYANCSTYNADFDGDEMNIHLPQSHDARAELRYVASNTNQYLGAKDGQPLRGLIQDHVLSGVLLTMRDRFFSRGDYQLLLYGALHSVRSRSDIRLEAPCILKPVQLWSGKQVISTIVKHLLVGRPLFNYRGPARVKWDDPHEDFVQFRGGELLTGVLDKSQCGNSINGFVHACYSLYGGEIAERLLSCLGRVFTSYLQLHGFTCGMEDFLLTPRAEAERKQALATALESSNAAMRTFLRAHAPGLHVDDNATSDELAHLLQEHIKQAPEDEVRLDSAMKQVSNGLTSAIVKAALPRGLLKPFPRNNFYLMVSSGAKGTDVNFSMIGCCLGQMELEGRRVARTVSGRTLPSFRPFQVDVVSGGFIGQRFLTGIKPQEYYFHCMAGREGLVDTAVKTSRSGYLQRCIIKHLETLVVRHDGTVRDSDDSIVQFQYGDDGLDPAHYRSVTNLKLLRDNVPILERRLKASNRRLPKQVHSDVQRYHRTPAAQRDRTLLRFHLPTELGLVSDTFLAQLEQADDFANAADRDQFRRLMMLHFLRGLAPAGEAVGVLAGQSIGEPSTQMTLNTFHLAGHGNVNVTLGVPRLRELLMVGGTPKLPTMAVPFKGSAAAAGIEAAKAAWTNASLAALFAESVIRKELPMGELYFSDTIYLRLREDALAGLGMTWKNVVQVVQREFVPRLIRQIRLDLRRKAAYHSMQADTSAAEGGHDSEEGGDDTGGGGEETRGGKKQKQKQKKGDDDDDDDDEGGNGDDDDDDDEAAADGGKRRKDATAASVVGGERAADAGAALAQGFVDHEVPALCSREKQGVFVESVWSLHTQAEKVVRIVVRSQASGEQILMSSILEATLKKQLVRELPGINRAVFSTLDKGAGSPLVMLTEGANVLLLAPWVHLLDVVQLKCNDIQHILRWYGVEAARAALIEEIAAVFKAYGIGVGHRHLSLIADYMTFQGEFRAFNRHAIARGKDSPFLKMSFETTANFAVNAALFGERDALTSPAGQLVVGTVPRVGTGCVDLIQPLHFASDDADDD